MRVLFSFAVRLTRTHRPQSMVHPVVIRHPESGRHAVFVNRAFTTHFEGWSAEDSRPLLEHVEALATLPENRYRHSYALNDVVMWDVRRTLLRCLCIFVL